MSLCPTAAVSTGAFRALAGLLLLAGAWLCLSEARAQDSSVINYRQMQETLQERARERAGERRPVIRRSRRSSVEEAMPPEEEAQPVEKLEDARVVMVIGDFMAGGLAEGLENLYAQSPGVVIDDESNGSSGLVRNDFYDWPARIGPLIEARHPAAVVVMIGSNDRQQMRVGDVAEPPRSDAWTGEYGNRVATIVKAVTGRGIPLVWVGLPAFKYASMSSDILAFNDIYQRQVEAAKGQFVDIWDGFVDENGAFEISGPDVNGQPVRLRSADGVGLSRAGKEKVAFYAEKPLNKILGDAVSPDAGSLGTEAPAVPAPGQLTPSTGRTAPMSLSDPQADGAELLGATVADRPKAGNSPAERLTVEGIAPPPRLGRADDFGGFVAAPPATAASQGPKDPATAAGSAAAAPHAAANPIDR
jgi:hypothetical protein